MSARTQLSAVRSLAASLALIMLCGCDSSATRAQNAFAEYQAATAAGDLIAARTALTKLLAVEEDEPEYWMELGKVHMQLQSYSDAYYAFTRAHELDRSNPEILQILMQIALRSGKLDQAEEHAEQLELLAPSNAGIKLTYGFIELRRGNLESALSYADQIIAQTPLDGPAKLLKSLVLLRQGDVDAATVLLEDQLRQRPDDGAALHGLAGLYERKQEWQKLAHVHQVRLNAAPDNPEIALQFIEAAFRARAIADARRVSLKLLAEDPTNERAAAVLDLWASYWPGRQRVADAVRLGLAAPPPRKPPFATFLNQIGEPREAAMLVKDLATLPVTRANLDFNSIFARSLALTGKRDEAKRRFDEILRVDSHNPRALNGRAELYLASGEAQAAIYDAQQLVSVRPKSPPARLLLYRAYLAAGERREAERTLWDAFHDIDANGDIYRALRLYTAQANQTDRLRQIDEEFTAQREEKVAREFI